MKVYKVELFFVDFDSAGDGSVVDLIESARYPNRCIAPNVLRVEHREIGEWSDDNPLNRADSRADEIRRLFGSATPPDASSEVEKLKPAR